MLYGKILVPVDGSENSYAALKEAIKVAKLSDGKITVIHVYLKWSTIHADSRDALHEVLEDQAKSVLENAEKIAYAENFKIKTQLLEGDIVQQIVKTADAEGFDLIVMGARGVGKLTELLLGSVSSGVLKNASCPVLITKEKG